MTQNRIKKNFSKLPNSIIEDNTISCNAKAIFWYIVSRPNDWIISNSHIQKTLNIKDKRTVSKNIKELTDSSYLTRELMRGEKGEIKGNYRYIINTHQTEGSKNAQSLHQNKTKKQSKQNLTESKDLQQPYLNEISHQTEGSKNAQSLHQNRIYKKPEYGKNVVYNNTDIINKTNIYFKEPKQNLSLSEKQKSKRSQNTNNKTELQKQPSLKSKNQKLITELLNLKLPENVSLQMWGDFVYHRLESKSKFTIRAAEMIIKKLSGFEKNARDEALREAIIHNWISVYSKTPTKTAFDNQIQSKTQNKNPQQVEQKTILSRLAQQGYSLLDVIRGKEIFIDNKLIKAYRNAQGKFLLQAQDCKPHKT